MLAYTDKKYTAYTMYSNSGWNLARWCCLKSNAAASHLQNITITFHNHLREFFCYLLIYQPQPSSGPFLPFTLTECPAVYAQLSDRFEYQEIKVHCICSYCLCSQNPKCEYRSRRFWTQFLCQWKLQSAKKKEKKWNKSDCKREKMKNINPKLQSA